MLAETGCVPEAPFERVLRERLARNEPLAFFKIDLVNFRTYLDEYSCELGDGVIEMLGRVICESIVAVGASDDYVAHLGWDEFAVVAAPAHAEALAQAIIARFDAAIPEHYSAEARRLGYIDRVDRRGNPYRAPFLGVAIAIVTNEKRDLMHPLQALHLASEVRGYLRFAPTSRYAFDRRQK